MSISTQGTPVTLASSITYMPFGGIASLTYGNSLSLTQTWDNQYRLSSITAGSVLSLSYGYDASGNVTSITDTIGSAPGQYIDSTTYAYESGTNRLTTITGTPTATLTHDANGNIITEGTRTFTYDLTNRLTAVTDNETEIASYVYDANNLRVKKTTPSETRIFHYDVNGHLIAETDTAGNTLVEYVYLSDMPLATVRPTDTVYYFHTDHINTPRVMTNSAGTVAWQAAYHGFGHAEVDGASTITNNIRFPGQYFDSETNLHYNWNRYYDPRTGRYLTPDPIGLEGGIDPYVYAENQPINWIDPKGLTTKSLGAGAYYGGGFEFVITTTTCCENNAEYLVKFVTVCGGAGISASGGFSRGILSGSIPFGGVSSRSDGCPKTRYYLKHETTFGVRSVNIQADKRGFSAGVDTGFYGIGTSWAFCSDTVIIKQVRSGCCRKSP